MRDGFCANLRPMSGTARPQRRQNAELEGPLARLLSPKVDAIYTVLRLVAGLMFAFHGIQKLFGVLTEHHPVVFTQIWFGGVLELVCGFLVAAGLFTRAAAFIASGEMAVAYTQFHWKLDLGARFFPSVNQGELALLYSFLFLYVAAVGGGPWSVDAKRIKSN
jgi:putative oxidoreductase